MGYSKEQDLVYNIKLSSVGPARVTGSDVVYEPNSIDLAMKLHYIKLVYFFSSQASQGMTITRIKESLFYWCNEYYMTSGRFRRNDDGRPFMKCNDCGVRFVEGTTDKTIDEWIEMKNILLNNLLVYHLPLGPDLFFSPPLYIQITKFRCGGMSMGVSWAHILGDPLTIIDCTNQWNQFLAGLTTNTPLKIIQPPTRPFMSQTLPIFTKEPLSLKPVEPVDDHWITANNYKMETFSFHLTSSHVSKMYSNMWSRDQIDQIPVFESLCAIIWQCIAKARLGPEPKVVTICKKDPNFAKNVKMGNNQIIISVETENSVVDSDVRNLAKLLANKGVDERGQIEELVEKDNGVSDYHLYGANLTFVNLEGSNLYGMEWDGYKPEFVHCTIQGVGDEGAVLVQPWQTNEREQGRVVTAILQENEISKLKSELRKKGLTIESDIE